MRAAVLVAASMTIVALAGFSSSQDIHSARVELLQSDIVTSDRTSKLSNIFSAPLEFAKNKMDQVGRSFDGPCSGNCFYLVVLAGADQV